MGGLSHINKKNARSIKTGTAKSSTTNKCFRQVRGAVATASNYCLHADIPMARLYHMSTKECNYALSLLVLTMNLTVAGRVLLVLQ